MATNPEDVISESPPRRKPSSGRSSPGQSSEGMSGEQTHSLPSERDEDGMRPRAEPVLANATYLLKNTQNLIDKLPVEVHEDHINTDYSNIEAKRSERIASNLRLDMNMFFEEHLQRELERHGTLTTWARKAVELIHDKLEFASLDSSKGGKLLVRSDLREEQIKHLTESLEGSYPEGKLKQFLADRDWSDANFKALLNSYAGPEDPRGRQVADTDMKTLRQLKTQVPYFGGSVEYQQNKRCLEYYIYHISTLTRDSKQQYGLGTPEGDVMAAKDVKGYHTKAEGMVPFGNLRNLGEGVTEERMPIGDWAPEIRKRAEIELNRLRTAPHEVDAKQLAWLDTFNAAWLQRYQDKHDKPAESEPSLAELWNASNEDLRKNLFTNVLRLPWSEAHLHGGRGFDQLFEEHQLEQRRSTESLKKRLPSRADGKPGLMNVAGVYANFLVKPEVASRQYDTDPKFIKLQEAVDNGTLAKLFPDAVPSGDVRLKKQFEGLHGDWYKSAMANFKPIKGGISGHELSYENVYDQAYAKLDPSERHKYPHPEEVRGFMLAGLIGTKRHHTYDEVMSASTATGNDKIPAESYQHPNSYEDVLKTGNDKIRECAEAALESAKKDYRISRNTVLAVIQNEVESNRKISPKKSERLTNAVDKYIESLGLDQEQAGKELSEAVKDALKPSILRSIKVEAEKLGEGVKKVVQRLR